MPSADLGSDIYHLLTTDHSLPADSDGEVFETIDQCHFRYEN